MALMYPDKPKSIQENSREDLMFKALEKLPDSYYVFHSFHIVTVKENVIHESETDFLVYNESKGILCIEAKNGQVAYSDGYWKYGNGIIMSHDGPYNQASQFKWKLQKYMDDIPGIKEILERCKMTHAVWFPAVKRSRFQGMSLPAEADLKLTLTQESEDDIEKAITDIFSYKRPNEKNHKLNSKDTEILINRVFAPHFNLVSIAEMKYDHNIKVFKEMLKEQVALLNYLEEQNNAVINGMAGTGKTIMAVTKAIRHADKEEKVLFLCYNVKLKDYLQEAYAHRNIDYYTIDGLACKMCDTYEANYNHLHQTLSEMYGDGFPYQHVIIDEGQDFEKADEMDIIALLKMNALDNPEKKGSFYLFYDKNQMVQSKKAPDFIDNSDCRLTLYRNCRNSWNIATTSIRFLEGDRKLQLMDGALAGDSTELFLANDIEMTVSTLNYIIEDLWENNYKNIQILTCSTEENSIIAQECSTGIYSYKKKRIPFTTCRKFKGLEADAIIMLDISKEMFSTEGNQLLYVGSSRAKFKLSLIVNMDGESCNDVLMNLGKRKSNRPWKDLAARYNAKYKEVK